MKKSLERTLRDPENYESLTSDFNASSTLKCCRTIDLKYDLNWQNPDFCMRVCEF